MRRDNGGMRKERLVNCTVGCTLFRVWVCPIRMRALEEMMERQKLIRMTERSERMYLQKEQNAMWQELFNLN